MLSKLRTYRKFMPAALISSPAMADPEEVLYGLFAELDSAIIEEDFQQTVALADKSLGMFVCPFLKLQSSLSVRTTRTPFDAKLSLSSTKMRLPKPLMSSRPPIFGLIHGLNTALKLDRDLAYEEAYAEFRLFHLEEALKIVRTSSIATAAMEELEAQIVCVAIWLIPDLGSFTVLRCIQKPSPSTSDFLIDPRLVHLCSSS